LLYVRVELAELSKVALAQIKVYNSKVISNKKLKIDKKPTSRAMKHKYKSKMRQKQRK
jgi:hypothetical protein